MFIRHCLSVIALVAAFGLASAAAKADEITFTNVVYEQMTFCDTPADADKFAATLAGDGMDAAIDQASYNGMLVNCMITQVDIDKVHVIETGHFAEFTSTTGQVVQVDQVIVTDPWFGRHQAVYRIASTTDLSI